MIKVEVADEIITDDPYQALLVFNYETEDEAIAFVKQMLHQGKTVLVRSET